MTVPRPVTRAVAHRSATAVARGRDRLSLIALGRRQLVRARHTRHGCSVVDLHVEPGACGLWLVALTAPGRPVGLPLEHLTTIQVLQGRIRVHRDGTGAAVLPGDLVLGPVPVDELIALTDVVLVVTGRPLGLAPVPA